MKEVLNISRNAREIVITGINLSSYGQDNNMRLSTLFQELSKVNSRIRIGSFYAEAIDEELLEVLKQMPNFCEHFHLSLQSGSNRILKMMNRHYTSQDYVDKVELIRLYFPLASITTDIIVGFPNETDEDFNKTTDLVTEIGFSDLHIFPFSPRPLTQAGMLTSLPPIIIENRRQKLFQIREQLKKAYLTKMIKYPHNVIFEQELGDGISFGHSEYYIKVYAKTNVTQGIVNATKLYKDGLIGAVTNNCV
jgi:threonylcarbamoyladenosine tRNA methylthiotransferase MtaB